MWAVSAAVDILISASLLAMLWTRRHNVFKDTTQILNRLSILIVNTGLWTSLITVLTLIGLQVVILEEQDIYAALSFITCPLYCNTLLANLNIRDYIRHGGRPQDATTIRTERVSFVQFDSFRSCQTSNPLETNDQWDPSKVEVSNVIA
ncbi:uncharacterized protein EV420DRAFT_1510150 [Desarmillaria tabescens]|uniref:DUF6534 domain-containing protein n=1 Tax=Armillaria tabescens TaxID=1929756 RepID=A0AA39TXM3_ARMTA|nr:uncharacterized protein EV420DRAFT_1510150 [Desarmillaria tabescens]KAK0466154.1 hypothetical protein EV420DRAFT_1510150 [Desarmillaria tabescens]